MRAAIVKTTIEADHQVSNAFTKILDEADDKITPFVDPVEEYFGGQQKLGRRSDNPDIKTFGYNSNTLRMQRTVSCQSGNKGAERTKHKPGNKLLMFRYHEKKT